MAKQLEAVLDGLKSLLDNNLGTAITSLNTEHNDGITLQQPAKIVFGMREAPMETPMVMIVPGGKTVPEYNGIEGDFGSLITWRYNIKVIIWLTEQEEEILQRKTLRYQRAVRETLLNGREGGTGAYMIKHMEDDVSIIFLADTSGYAQFSSVSFELYSEQIVS